MAERKGHFAPVGPGGLPGTDQTDVSPKDKDADGLEIVTLEDAVYLSQKNDCAVCVQASLALFEQQSSWNPNMPLRGFLYFAAEYAGWLARRQLPDLLSAVPFCDMLWITEAGNEKQHIGRDRPSGLRCKKLEDYIDGENTL